MVVHMPNGMMNVNPNTNGRANVNPSDSAGEIADPQSNSQVYYGSFASILSQNLGQYVVVDFLIGTDRLETREGILYSSGINFLSLYDPIDDRYIVCDLYAVKFVTFYNTTTVPASRLRQNGRLAFENSNDASMQAWTNDMNTNNYMQQGMGMNWSRGNMRGY